MAVHLTVAGPTPCVRLRNSGWMILPGSIYPRSICPLAALLPPVWVHKFENKIFYHTIRQGHLFLVNVYHESESSDTLSESLDGRRRSGSGFVSAGGIVLAVTSVLISCRSKYNSSQMAVGIRGSWTTDSSSS